VFVQQRCVLPTDTSSQPAKTTPSDAFARVCHAEGKAASFSHTKPRWWLREPLAAVGQHGRQGKASRAFGASQGSTVCSPAGRSDGCQAHGGSQGPVPAMGSGLRQTAVPGTLPCDPAAVTEQALLHLQEGTEGLRCVGKFLRRRAAHTPSLCKGLLVTTPASSLSYSSKMKYLHGWHQRSAALHRPYGTAQHSLFQKFKLLIRFKIRH